MPLNAAVNAKTKTYILDSFALLAYLGGEAGGDQVSELLDAARRQEVRLLLPLVNLGEIAYIIERSRGLEAAHLALATLEQQAIEMIAADKKAILAAAHIKANHPLSYADAFVVAAAMEHDAAVVTGDPEILAIEPLIQTESLA